ncbi:hypothetical protein NP493_28g03055 [Ridgeia piscesae]|uniref:Transporter n=1 Tax=Ridgeia piscesae TaxID=27915 RepID=A0AAD9PD77_RIDPI|nr:hypothetical protein NP493_28g03055 [Ridgeia piscesae]
MSALSFAVGMGNLWRFPYLCYSNGGGAFLLVYLILAALVGFPLMFLEFSFGQYGRQGIVSIWKSCPIFEGVGWAMFSVSFIVSIYYNMLVAYCVFYVFASFAKDVPWRDCGNPWNTAACSGPAQQRLLYNCTAHNGTWYENTCYTQAHTDPQVYKTITNLIAVNGTISPKLPADEYFHNYMLDISGGPSELGYPSWKIALCLLLCWAIVVVTLSKGIKSSGKVTYVTALFPYVIMAILFVRGIMLEGALEGIYFYITPKWEKLLSAKLWGDAAMQVFFSLSICWGGLITLATYNDFHNNSLRDAAVVTLGDSLTSVFGGVVIFSFIGSMANTLNMPVADVATKGAGLAFIIYPQAVTTLPVSQLWSILFMLMLMNVGIGTMFTLVQTVQTTLVDAFPRKLGRGRRPQFLLFAICLLGFLLGLPLTTRGGMYILQLMDQYAATYTILSIGLAMVIGLAWVYGLKRYFSDIEVMLNRRLGLYWVVMWRFVTPGVIIFILLFSLVGFKPTQYGDYIFPPACEVIGWILSTVEFMFIPGVAIYKLCTTERGKSLIERLRILTTPHEDWGHKDEARKEENQIPLSSAPNGIDADAHYA